MASNTHDHDITEDADNASEGATTSAEPQRMLVKHTYTLSLRDYGAR